MFFSDLQKLCVTFIAFDQFFRFVFIKIINATDHIKFAMENIIFHPSLWPSLLCAPILID